MQIAVAAAATPRAGATFAVICHVVFSITSAAAATAIAAAAAAADQGNSSSSSDHHDTGGAARRPESAAVTGCCCCCCHCCGTCCCCRRGCRCCLVRLQPGLTRLYMIYTACQFTFLQMRFTQNYIIHHIATVVAAINQYSQTDLISADMLRFDFMFVLKCPRQNSDIGHISVHNAGSFYL